MILFVGVLVLMGCGNKDATNNLLKEEAKKEITSQPEEKKGGVISSIKDAMGLGKTMRCEYKFKGESGELNSIAYVDGRKYKAESTVMGKKQLVVFDETAMYSWAEGEKNGMKMTTVCMKEMEKNIPKEQGGREPLADSKTDEEFFDDATDVKCEAASGVDFSIPTDIVFADQCEMLKNMLQNAPTDIPGMPKGAPNNMPQGMPGNIPQIQP
jgi:hypothetical protein